MRPFMGQLGTMPAIDLPDSHNAGDFGTFLLGAPHDRALTAEELEHRTDGHMDIDAVRAGAIVVCPVKVAGGGVYLGGGIAPKLLRRLTQGDLREAFERKGRMQPFVAPIPIYVILAAYPALKGAAVGLRARLANA